MYKKLKNDYFNAFCFQLSLITRVKPVCGGFLICLLVLACGGGDKNGTDTSRVPATRPGPAENPSQVHWVFEPDALELVIYSQKDLNTYNGYAHATMLCVYQLKEPSGFTRLRSSKAGLKKLLQCKDFDSTVVDFEKFYIQPGHNSTRSLARA
mgnify:CR=1 FL=1